MDAVITAGGRIRGEFAKRTRVKLKALLDVGGMPVVHRVIDALKGLPEVERILVVGPEEWRQSSIADSTHEIIPEAEDGAANFLLGLDQCSSHNGSRAIFAASDLPFVTTSALRSFLDMCPSGADFCYPVVRKEQFLKVYPDGPVQFAPLRDGYYTGGSVFLLNPVSLLANRALIERIFTSRKSLLRLSSILGWQFVFRLLTRTATVEACARRASQIIGCDCQVVMDSPPELAYDLDDFEDYEYALRHIER